MLLTVLTPTLALLLLPLLHPVALTAAAPLLVTTKAVSLPQAVQWLVATSHFFRLHWQVEVNQWRQWRIPKWPKPGHLLHLHLQCCSSRRCLRQRLPKKLRVQCYRHLLLQQHQFQWKLRSQKNCLPQRWRRTMRKKEGKNRKRNKLRKRSAGSCWAGSCWVEC